MRKVIFLDIDGVLNSFRWHNSESNETQADRFGRAFDPVAVANLSKIVEETGADIVISSSWKCFGLDGMQEMWKERNLPGKVIGITPNTVSDEMLLYADLENMELGVIRGNEIKEWLSRHRHISQYVIIDDMDDMLPEQQYHVVLTDPLIGLSKCDAMKAIAILNK